MNVGLTDENYEALSQYRQQRALLIKSRHYV